MAKKIIWSNYLKEEAIFRFWYTLENNNFKNAIKFAQKQGKMNYAYMHNALYSGLYYPEKNYEYPYRAIKDIRKDKNLKYNATIANFMPRDEILMNIHSMNESARAIRKLAPFGYNAKLFAKEFNMIGKDETALLQKIKIKNDSLFNSTPQTEDELVPNKPNRYNLSRTFLKQQKNNPFVFKKDTSKERDSHFKKALAKYKKAKASFDYQLNSLNIKEDNKNSLLSQFLDAGLYRSSIAHFGFDFDFLVSQAKDPKQIVTAKELLLHADKFTRGAKVLSGLKTFKGASQVEEDLIEAGLKSRLNFIKQEKSYPETKIGFLNAFCEMISHNLEINPLLKDKVIEKDTPKMADTLIDVILKLKNQYLETKDKEERKEIDLQMKKIQKSLETSNEHNI